MGHRANFVIIGNGQAKAYHDSWAALGCLEGHKGAPLHLVGRLEVDDWGGRRKPKLRIEDVSDVT